MSIPFLDNLDLSKNEIQNVVFQRLATAPSSPVTGQFYYDTTINKFGVYNGTVWIYQNDTTGLGNVSQSANSTNTGVMKVSAGSNKDITDYTGGAGLLKSDANGVVSPAVASTDYATMTDITNAKNRANHTGTQTVSTISDFASSVLAQVLTGLSTATNSVIASSDSVLSAFGKLQAQITGYSASTKTFTNTTIDATGTGNSITNLSTTNLSASAFTTTVNASSTNTQIPSALSVYNAITSSVTSLGTAKGGIDCSTNPNYPAGVVGDYYRITVAGKIGGASGMDVSAGDVIQCFVDSASGTQASVGANWNVIQANVEQATTSTLGLVSLATSTEAEAKTDSQKAVTASSLTRFTVKKTFTIGDGTSTSFTCTHSLGTTDCAVAVRRVSDNALVFPTLVNTSTSVTTVSFGSAPASNSYVVTIIG